MLSDLVCFYFSSFECNATVKRNAKMERREKQIRICDEEIWNRRYKSLVVYSLCSYFIHMEWFVFICRYKHTTSTNNANCYNFKTAELSVGKKCIIGSVYYAANTLQWRREYRLNLHMMNKATENIYEKPSNCLFIYLRENRNEIFIIGTKCWKKHDSIKSKISGFLGICFENRIISSMDFNKSTRISIRVHFPWYFLTQLKLNIFSRKMPKIFIIQINVLGYPDNEHVQAYFVSSSMRIETLFWLIVHV